MYESPIKLNWEEPVVEKIGGEWDRIIMKAVQKAIPEVNIAELIKALQYDRDQYNKGYLDGLKDGCPHYNIEHYFCNLFGMSTKPKEESE